MTLTATPAVAVDDDDVAGKLQRTDGVRYRPQRKAGIVSILDGAAGAAVHYETGERDG